MPTTYPWVAVSGVNFHLSCFVGWCTWVLLKHERPAYQATRTGQLKPNQVGVNLTEWRTGCIRNSSRKQYLQQSNGILVSTNTNSLSPLVLHTMYLCHGRGVKITPSYDLIDWSMLWFNSGGHPGASSGGSPWPERLVIRERLRGCGSDHKDHLRRYWNYTSYIQSYYYVSYLWCVFCWQSYIVY